MRFITLTEEERILIDTQYKRSSSPVVRERCMFLKLSSQNKSMMEISRIMEVGRLRVTIFFNAWENAGNLSEKEKSLGIKKGRGAKLKLEKVKDVLPDLVKENSRNLNVVLDILDKKYEIKVTKPTLRNFLK